MKKIYIILGVLIAACTGFNIYSRTGESSARVSENKNLRDELSFLKKGAFFSFYDNGKYINDSLIAFDQDRSYTMHQFLDRFVKTDKLFFRYSDINCTACVDSSLLKIKSYSERMKDTNVIILASYQTARDLYVWKRINKIKNPVLRIPYKSLGLRAEGLSEPYFFVLQKRDRKVQNLFIPAKEYMGATEEYLQVMATKITSSR